MLRMVLLVVVGGLFLWAGGMKAADPAAFARQIEDYRLLPPPACAALALYLPWLEIACAVGLVRRSFREGALWVLAILLAVFTLALLSAWARGLNITCGCFGSNAGHPNYPWLVSRDLSLLPAIVWLEWKERAFH